MKIRVGHLYPDYLNIYADRGNIAVFARRAALRGHELDVTAISVGDGFEPGEHDLLYIGGGQDREQALIAPDLVDEGTRRSGRRSTAGPRSSPSAAATSCSAAATSTATASRSPASASFPHETVAGERRMIGDVLLEMRARARRAPDGRGFREPCGPDPA